MKNLLKQVISPPIRLQMRVLQRQIADLPHSRSLTSFQPLSQAEQARFQPRLLLTQALLPTQYSHNKKHNLALAIQRIQNVSIAPEQIFSFWHLVGQPNAAKGYLEGRSLIGNSLKAEVGGGLCQLSGVVYFLALRAGLVVLERHSHSRDIYTEETRFAPLGSDATVVYGYKDLRFYNQLSTPVCFRFDLTESKLSASLCSPEAIDEFAIEFKSELVSGGVNVHTIRSNLKTSEIINITTYKR